MLHHFPLATPGTSWFAVGIVVLLRTAMAAETQVSYYAHPIAEDRLGVVAPWYGGQNGQFDFRIQRAAEVLLNSGWSVRNVGAATVTVPESFWGEGDLDPGMVQRGARALFAFVEYYRYTGDPAVFGHIEAIANTVLDLCQTGPDHSWPRFLMSVPYGGAGPEGKATSQAHIQLDIVAEFGVALLRAYRLLGNERWLVAAEHWRTCSPRSAVASRAWPRGRATPIRR